MGRDGRTVLVQFALAGVTAGLLWFGAWWLAPVVIRGMLGGW